MIRPHRILWADLHNHNEIGYGKGTLSRSYEIARNTLDVYAFTVHGYWPDPPDTDPALVNYHTSAFDAVSKAFSGVVDAANQNTQPGEFVALIGYEWHSTQWGDYVVLFPGDTGKLHRAQTLEELQRFVREQGALMIPHHIAYRKGWRGLDWTGFDPNLSPLVEIFSEHGSSFERDGLGAMLQHSMGGVTSSQTVIEQLKRGAHFGFTAGTDTHFGYPGSHGEGITGIYSSELTRDAVFDALKKRHTFAATGDRIEIEVESNGALPGDRLPSAFPRRFAFQVRPLGPLDYVEVIKNGRRAELWPGMGDSVAPRQDGRFLVRVEWGWGRMENAEETAWRIVLKLEDGEIVRAIPCLGGGDPAVGKRNLVTIAEGHVQVESFTSRRNPAPIYGVVLEIDARPNSRLTCEASATVQEKNSTCGLGATVAQLQEDDVWGAPFTRFSSPRVRIGRAHSRSALDFTGVYDDPSPGAHDTYVFKVRQTNGHTAWTSPYLFTDGRSMT